jgi:hypothetical protein
VLALYNNLWGTRNRAGYRVVVPARQATQAGGNDSVESILGLLNSLKIGTLKLPSFSRSSYTACYHLAVFADE